MSDQQGFAMIEAEGLSKYYGSFAAIQDITFQIPQGEVVAFLGPNGAGKSTTMKLLTGYLAPSAGVARIGGHDMTSDRLAGSARLGYLPENGPLYTDMTPRACCNSSPRPGDFRRREPASEWTPSSSYVPWAACWANPSASCRGVIANGWAWPRCYCTSPTC